jgi:hypothetical protein
LDNDNITLRLAKFAPHDAVIARKKDPPPPLPGGVKAIKGKISGPLAEDLIKPKDLQTDPLILLTPLQWLSSSVAEDQSLLYPRNDMKGDKPPRSLLIDVFLFPPFTLPSRTDMTLIPHGDILPSSAAHMDLVPLLQQSPQHMDQLLAMLDGYLSAEIQRSFASFDISAAVWAVLQSLPTHPSLLKQVREMPYDRTGTSIRALLTTDSPFKLLYVLQVLHLELFVYYSCLHWLYQFIHTDRESPSVTPILYSRKQHYFNSDDRLFPSGG